ncbi:putative receptor-like protein kinase, partial [Trifolium medium]|nr:putative receptor-like protein kinase [Trifolium medium]
MKAASSSKSGKAIDSALYFRYDEIAAACHNFSIYRCMSECLSSTIYKASFDHEASSKKLKATVTCLHQSTQRLSKGSLDHLLFGRSDGPSIDWNTRIKIAICAAQALTFLHEEGPLQ